MMTTVQQLPLFVFGTLRRGQCNHHLLAGHYERVVTARLGGFAKLEPLMIARHPGGVVGGELYFLQPAAYAKTLRRCDELEGIPAGSLVGRYYRRLIVKVEFDGGSDRAWVYAHSRTFDQEAAD